MEVLVRKRPAAPIVVKKDDSLTLSFRVPASLDLKRKEQAVDVAAPREIGAEIAQDEEDDDDESWEDKVEFNLNVEERPTWTGAKLDEEEWEEDVEAFPDDFPILLVNLTRLSAEHMGRPLTSNEEASKVSDAIQDIFASRKFSYVLEVLMEQEIAFHSTYGVYKTRLNQLTSQSTTDVWAAIDYPALVDDEYPLSEILDVLRRQTKWRSVNYIKDSMAQSSRDIKWKAQVIYELEKLAETEHEEKNAHMDTLRVEIDQLTDARSLYMAKVEGLRDLHDTKSVVARNFAASRLEEVESRLSVVLEEFLNPSAKAMEQLAQQNLPSFQLHDMNVVDMIISMIFSRLPKLPQTTMEAHYKSLMDSHHHIRKLWIEDFGRLPPKSRAVADDEENEEASRAQEEELRRQEEESRVREIAQIRAEVEKVRKVETQPYTEDADDEAEAGTKRREKKKKRKSKKESKPFACVAGLAMLQISQDEAAYLLD